MISFPKTNRNLIGENHYFLAICSAASFPEVKAQALLAPEGESVPITPPTTSPAA